MTHANVEKMLEILGPQAECFEMMEDDFDVVLPIGQSRKVVAFDLCGAYVFASAESHRDFHRAVEYRDSPVLDGMDWCDFGDRASANHLACMIEGSTYHSGGNNWHTIWMRADDKVVIFCEDGIAMYPSIDAWYDGDPSEVEGAAWIDYAELRPGGPSPVVA